VRPDGSITFPPGALRAHRYQVARFAAWTGLDDAGYHYRITPGSLEGAERQGLRAGHVRTILEACGGGSLPAPLARALERWFLHGTEARIEKTLVLKVKDAGVLQFLRSKRSTGRYLGEILGATSVTVRAQDWPKLAQAAARMGLLIDPPKDAPPEP
jgi:hypothetical protein